jgi:hypothetical protein
MFEWPTYIGKVQVAEKRRGRSGSQNGLVVGFFQAEQSCTMSGTSSRHENASDLGQSLVVCDALNRSFTSPDRHR